jgi:adenosylcobinamide-GDP ribazoletransferase
MTTVREWAERLVADLTTSVVFCTRLPIAQRGPEAGAVERASWAFPLAGALVGTFGGLIYWIAHRLGVPPSLAAGLALIATLVLTGALHEDGLADTADGFGGGNGREAKLAIMHDSRIGTYGTCALVSSIVLRWSAVAAIARPHAVVLALFCSHAAARAILPAFMLLVPPARKDGLSFNAGRPAWESSAIAVIFGLIALAVALGPAAAIAVLLLLAAGVGTAWLSMRQIGGQTGDVLGALEQVAESLILLVAVAALRPQ